MLIGLALSLAAGAQQISLVDSLRAAFKAEPKLTGKLDGRISLLSGSPARVQGVKLGLSFMKRVEVGLSYNWLASDNYSLKTSEDAQLIKLRYFAPYIQYRYTYRNRWRISIPVQIGIGRSFLVQDPERPRQTKSARGWVMMYEPAMHVDYLFLKYFNVGVGVGLRLMLVNNTSIDERFTAPTAAFHLGVDIGQLWADSQNAR